MPKRQVTVTNNHPTDELGIGNTVSVLFDHKSYVDREVSRADGMDIYMWHPKDGNFPAKIIAPNTDYARLCFSLRDNILANGGVDNEYRMCYGYLDRPVQSIIQPQYFSQFLARNPAVNPSPNGPFLWFDDFKYYHDGSKWVPTTLLDPPDPGTYNTGGNPFGITDEGIGQIVPTFPPFPPLSYIEVVNSTATVFRVRTEIRVSATFDVIEFLGVGGRITSSGWTGYVGHTVNNTTVTMGRYDAGAYSALGAQQIIEEDLLSRWFPLSLSARPVGPNVELALNFNGQTYVFTDTGASLVAGLQGLFTQASGSGVIEFRNIALDVWDGKVSEEQGELSVKIEEEPDLQIPCTDRMAIATDVPNFRTSHPEFSRVFRTQFGFTGVPRIPLSWENLLSEDFYELYAVYRESASGGGSVRFTPHEGVEEDYRFVPNSLNWTRQKGRYTASVELERAL